MIRRNRVELPPRTGRQRAVEWVKSALIVVLLCSAVYLAGRSQLYRGVTIGWLDTVLGQTDTAPVSTSPPVARMRIQPSSVAFCTGVDLDGVRERCGIQYDALAVERAFDEISRYLGEALASAGPPQPVTQHQWQGALQAPGLYLDLLGKVPLSALAAWLGDGHSGCILTGEVRRLVLADQGGTCAVLYYINEENGLYYACETAVPVAGEFTLLLSSRSANGARFAFEAGERFASINPNILLQSDTPIPLRYTGSTPPLMEDQDQLNEIQRRLSFQPAGYPTWNSWVNDTLRISGDGVIRYDGRQNGDRRYPVPMVDGTVDLSQAVSIARGLADILLTLGQNRNEARLYLIGAEQNEGGWIIRFGYALNGIMVEVDGQQTAATFWVSGGRITTYELRMRYYTALGEDTEPLLPEAQAAAGLSALGYAGRELLLCYRDSGVEEAAVSVGWAAR
ncbi:MAG: hypothetical protein HFE97_07125 [Oscillospiraceae bacterium]|nr:hypothetical protein [Oscillospiraceae bacterium]